MKQFIAMLALLLILGVAQAQTVRVPWLGRVYSVSNTAPVTPPPSVTASNVATFDITFGSTPTNPTVSLTDLLYNKSLGLTLTKDDGNPGDITTFYPGVAGGPGPDGQTYPAWKYGDGAGDSVKAQVGLAWNMGPGTDSHSNGVATTWAQLATMLNSGHMHLLNHSLTHSGGDIQNQIKGFEKLAWTKLLAFGIQYKTNTIVMPADNEGFVGSGPILGYKFYSSAFATKTWDGLLSSNILFNSRIQVPLAAAVTANNYIFYSNRGQIPDNWTNADLAKVTTDVSTNNPSIDNMFAAIAGGNKFIYSMFSHGPTGTAQFLNFMAYRNYITNHPSNGDKVWLTSPQGVNDYFQTKAYVVKSQQLTGNTLRVTLDYSNVPKNVRFQTLSFLVSGGTIASVSQVGGTKVTFNPTTGLVNLYRDITSGFSDPNTDVVPPLMVSAINYAGNDVAISYDKPVSQTAVAGYRFNATSAVSAVVSATTGAANNPGTAGTVAVAGQLYTPILQPGSGSSTTIPYSWSAVDYATGYNLTIANNAGFSSGGSNTVTTVALGNVTSYTFTGAASTQYFARITAIASVSATSVSGSGTSWQVHLSSPLPVAATLDYRINVPGTLGNAFEVGAPERRVLTYIGFPMTYNSANVPTASSYTLTLSISNLTDYQFYLNGEALPGNQIVIPSGTLINSITPALPGYTLTPASYSNVTMDANKTLTFSAQ